MFKGTYVAIVTPFAEDGSVDEQALRNLVDIQIEKGINGIVPCGTTGESPTLSHEEHDRVIEIVTNQAKGRCKIIGGAGSNSTTEAIRLTKHAKETGCDAVLSVNPYYNKPTQEGLYRHFKAINDAVDIPIILYNIYGRTAVNIETTTLLRLAELKNIVGVKEASGNINQIKEVIEKVPEDFTVLSGDDNITLKLIRLGGQGVISVLANLLPDKMSNMVNAALEGNFEEAEKINAELVPLFEAEYIETNPIPIKAMLAMKELIKENYRLPMCELQLENRTKVEQALKKAGVL